jgi:peroxiredoxin
MARELRRSLLPLLSLATALLPTAGRAGDPPPRAPAVVVDPDKLQLTDAADGKPYPLRQLAGPKATVVFFAGSECPVAQAYEQRLSQLAPELEARGVKLLAVSSNDGDTLDTLRAHRAAAKLPYPLYLDEGGRLAETVGAVVTSEVALLDPEGRAVYQGRIDDQVSLAGRRASARQHELADAVDALLAGRPVAVPRTRAAGCYLARRPKAERAADVTYAKQVAPLVQKYCVTCHRRGQAGPMALETYEQVAAWSRTVLDVLQRNQMPPSRLAPPDPRYGEFLHMPEPTPQEIDVVARWVAAGAPRGAAGKPPGKPPAPAPASRAKPDADADVDWLIGEPDLVVSMPQTFTVPASGVVPYQYYDLMRYTGDERWVEAIEIRPTVRSVVHHANVYMDQPELLTVGFDAGERWASYAPGRPPTTFPAGVARRLPKNAKLTLEVHYTPDGVEREDRIRIGIRFARKPPRYETRSIPLGTLNFEIPPHAASHEVTGTYTLKGDARIAAFTPHMHDRGKDFRYEAVLPDGTVRTLLSVPRYNFKWQFVYVPKEMIALPKGTVLRAIAHYDNSDDNPRNPDPSATVSFGYQTFEEMMFGFVELVYDEEASSPRLRALRAADRQSMPQDRGFGSWKEYEAWGKAFAARQAAKAR